MSQKDYVGRSGAPRKNAHRKKRNTAGISKTIMALAIALVIFFIGGLYLITYNKPGKTPMLTPGNNHSIINGLPPKPEERWRYIKELESRQPTVQTPTKPPAGHSISAQPKLTNEQRLLLEQMQADMNQQPTKITEVPGTNRIKAAHSSTITKSTGSATQQSLVSSSENTPPSKMTEKSTVSQALQSDLKKNKTQRWIVQCGSFRSTNQAETIRAQLAFAGLESRIVANSGWNRVILGPYNNRPLADNILQQLTNSGISGCIPLTAGG